METLHIPTSNEINAMSDGEYKILENRVRRMAARQGYRLQKHRSRDPRHYLYCTYQLVDAASHGGVMLAAWGTQNGYGLALDEILESLLTEDES